MVSPSRNPRGFNGSIGSKISLTIAVIGMDLNIPGIPQSAPNARTSMMDISALNLTFDAIIQSKHSYEKEGRFGKEWQLYFSGNHSFLEFISLLWRKC